MSILPVPEDLPGLARRPGLTSWRVLDNSLADAPHPSASSEPAEVPGDMDVEPVDGSTSPPRHAPKGRGNGKPKGKGEPNNQDKKGSRKTWLASLWPPAENVAKEQGLQHSLRLYPHLQDTGAFFVCVLVKKDEVPQAQAVTKEEKTETKRERASSPVQGEPEPKKARAEEKADSTTDTPTTEPSAKTPTESVETPKPQNGGDEPGKERMGAGRPFNEEPYIYLNGIDDEQVKICK